MSLLCSGNAREKGAGALESLRGYIAEKFDNLTLDLQRCQGDTVNHLFQLQDQIANLEIRVKASRENSRKSNKTPRGSPKQTTSFDLQGTNGTSEALQPHAADAVPNGQQHFIGLASASASAFAFVRKEPNELMPLLHAEDGHAGASGEHGVENLNLSTYQANPNHRASRETSSPLSFRAVTSTTSIKDALPNTHMTFHEKLRFAQDQMQKGKVELPYSVKVVTAFLEDPESGPIALLYSQVILIFSIFAIIVGLSPYVGLEIPVPFEVAIDSVLCLEILIRCVFCPNFKAFVQDPSNLIDWLSALPLTVIFLMSCDDYFDAYGGPFLLAAVPVIRFLRLVRRFPKMQILISAFKDCLEALPVLLYTLAVMGCIFTSAMYLVEPRDNIETVSECAWLIISTISTVGYGDITPSTKSGSAIASVLMVVSQLYMAMPFGIIGYNFTIIWENRARILLINSTKSRLAKWGFGAYEIPHLFELFDLDESAEFDMHEFQLLFQEMDIGFRDEEIVELFKLIDIDSGGTIDEKEFVRTVYPNEYRHMYGKSANAKKTVSKFVHNFDFDTLDTQNSPG